VKRGYKRMGGLKKKRGCAEEKRANDLFGQGVKATEEKKGGRKGQKSTGLEGEMKQKKTTT